MKQYTQVTYSDPSFGLQASLQLATQQHDQVANPWHTKRRHACFDMPKHI